ncbi:tripartite motif-containing protein 2-like [Anneissia japonica]|uniref:tripartite motif-containing protein 2-like n=1 Tax=Anneissia japonica TaxID=1529436 RepID=UPI001425B9D7|nr:tripartite motif-containing protein 2-like [Anneissia japonica]
MATGDEYRVSNFNQSSKKFGASGLNVNNAHDVKEFNDEVFITDTNNHRVVVTALDGSLRRYIECQDESLNGDFDPWGIAISVTSEMYVTDMKSHVVLKFDTTGKLSQKFGSAELQKPYGIAMASANARSKILVVDLKRCCVCIFNHGGILLRVCGHRGKGLNELDVPRLIALNSKGNWIIADYGNRRLIIIEGEDNPPRSVSIKPENRNYLVRGVTVDEKDNIIVSVISHKTPMIGRHCSVLMYNSEYTYMGCISKPTDVYMPRGMCVTHKNEEKSLLVACHDGIHQYTFVETTSQTSHSSEKSIISY